MRAGHLRETSDSRSWISTTSAASTNQPANIHPRPRETALPEPANHLYRRVLDALRALGAVRSLPDVDASSIAVQGSSQGGGGLTNGLVAVMPDVPFLCHFRRAADICDEPPHTEIIRYLAIHRGVGDSAFTTLSYFDGVSFAKRASAPAYLQWGL